MMTTAQAKAMSKGMLATLERVKEEDSVDLTITFPSHVNKQQIFDAIKHTLYVRGNLNPATSSITINSSMSDLRSIIAHQEKQLREHQVREAALMEELRALKAMPQPIETGRWMQVREAAEVLCVSENTLYLAIKDNRIKHRSKLVEQRQSHKVDVDTFVRKIRAKKQA
jgi:hypothetical protein